VNDRAVDADRDALAPIAEDRPQSSEQEREGASEALRRAIHQLDREPADPQARDVHEVGGALGAVGADEAGSTRVDRAGRSLGDALEGTVDPPRDSQAPAEVAPGAERQQADPGVAGEIGGQQSRRHLGEGPVASGDHDLLYAGADAFSREPLGVTRGFRVLDLDGAQNIAQPRLDPTPATSGRAVPARGVDDDERALRHEPESSRTGPPLTGNLSTGSRQPKIGKAGSSPRGNHSGRPSSSPTTRR
jgi:hypothetical protein